MSTQHRVKIATLENQAFALMSRLHVALRRQTGRITDIEYMRVDPGYCQHVLQLAIGSENVDLFSLGEKLQEIYFGDEGLFVLAPPKPPLLARIHTPPPPPSVKVLDIPAATPTAPASPPPVEMQRAYVGTLR